MTLIQCPQALYYVPLNSGACSPGHFLNFALLESPKMHKCVAHRSPSPPVQFTFEVKKKQKYEGLRSAKNQNNSADLKRTGLENR